MSRAVVRTGILNEPVLTLNRNWIGLECCPVKKAISKVCKGSAKFVDSEMMTYTYEEWAAIRVADDERALQANMSRVKIPEIIVLVGSKYERKKREIAFSRKNLLKRDRYTCMYCGKQPGPSKLTIDHILPKAKGGRTSWLNCVLACFECNLKKADKMLSETNLHLRNRPFEPQWSPIYRVPHGNYKESWKQFLPEKYFA